MTRNDAFSLLHPAVTALYFAFVFVFSMCLMHPVCLLLSALCAGAYAAHLGKGKSFLFSLPMLLLTLLVNPAFNHEGATILWYFPSGNPLTLESLLYGAASGMMLFAVISWFSCFGCILTSDKFVYLFGRVIPALSLVLSMALRFVPRFGRQFAAAAAAQKALGRGLSDGNLLRRLAAAVKIFSIVLSWSLENAIETADSMKSRGYGLSGRTAFSIYRFGRRDLRVLLYLLLLGGGAVALWIAGGFAVRYFPTFRAAFSPLSALSFTLYAALLVTPFWVNLSEFALWKKSKSAI